MVSFGGKKDRKAVGGVGPCKKKKREKLPGRQLFGAAPADETFSGTFHKENDLLNVTFISPSFGKTSTIVVSLYYLLRHT